MCPHCRAFITTSDKVCPYCNERVGPRAVERYASTEALGGLIPQARFTTVIILLLNFGLYMVTTVYSMGTGMGNVMDIDVVTLRLFGAKFTPLIAAGQWWRLVIAGFLHGGLMHILMNSWALFDLGAAVEEAYGTARLLTIYFLSTVAGFYASAAWNPIGTSSGSSAAICGLLGAMIALGLRDRSSMGDAMRGMYVRWLVFIMIISLLPRVDMAAHVGGLASGFGVAYLAGQPRFSRPAIEGFWKVAAAFCLFLTAASFLLWYLWFHSFHA